MRYHGYKALESNERLESYRAIYLLQGHQLGLHQPGYGNMKNKNIARTLKEKQLKTKVVRTGKNEKQTKKQYKESENGNTKKRKEQQK